jgi:phosphatidylglycerophosphate synthase
MPPPLGVGANSVVYRRWRALIRSCPALCSVPPNVVTLLGVLLTVPIAHNLVRMGPLWVLLVLTVLREALDMLDGTLARECGTGTAIGAVLDIACDTIYTLAVGIAVIYALWPLRHALDWVVVGVVLLSSASLVRELLHDLGACTQPLTAQHRWVADQTIVIVPLALVLVKLWLQRRTSSCA